MTFEKTLKRVFPILLVLPVLISTYWQASGAMALFGSSALPLRVEQIVAQHSLAPPNAVASRERLPSASPIILRNPFDHTTDLAYEPPPIPADPPPREKGTRVDVSDPLGAEVCEDVEAEIVTQSVDPEDSIAVLQEQGEKSGVARRIGDTLGDFTVEYIGFNRRERSPSVWMTQGTELCQVLLFGGEREAEEKAKPKKRSKSKRKRSQRRPLARVPPGIADGIEKVTATEFDVDRSVLDDVLEKKAQLMRGTRIVPEKGKGGGKVGLRIFGVRSETLLGTLGFKNGDRVETINGFDITDPQKALQAYARLRMANSLEVKLTRRGKPVTIDLNIK